MDYLQLKVFALHGEEVYSDIWPLDEEERAYERLAEQLRKVPCCNGYLLRVHEGKKHTDTTHLVIFDTFTGVTVR